VKPDSTHRAPDPSLRLRLLDADGAAELQTVFVAAGDYFLPITGRAAPDPDAAERELRGAASTPGREVALVEREGGAAGALGWWQGQPEPDVALLGMLMVVPALRGRGVAQDAVALLEARLRSEGVARLRAGVGSTDFASHTLLRRLGFAELNERTHVSLDRGRMMLSLWEKPVAGTAPG
jgi:RimJ/RimL family protein N-acetyltransferase